jgi:nitrite reductase/ring-hydroxylating ferredoxin subunit
MQKHKMLKNKSTARLKLCPTRALPEGAAKGFTVTRADSPLGIFIISQSGQLHGYYNRCPHAGTPLDWTPDQFLDKDNALIQCSTHGALFRIDNGLCVQGPCVNQSLSKIELCVMDGDIYWLTAKN